MGYISDSVVYAKWTGTGGGGGGGGALDVQRPIIEAGKGVTVSLNPDGTVASITVKEGYELDDVILNGASKGKVTTVSGLKTGDRLTVNGRKIGEQTLGGTGGIELMSRYKLIARSSYAVSPKGKQAILIKWRDRNGLELNFDGVEIFRSTERFSGFGKKPIFDTSLGRYYNTDIEGGVKYYYKVRGYIKIGGVKYYTDWSRKAFRVAKTKSTK